MIHHRGYSYAAASALVLAMMITWSLIQPLFGHLADRRSLPWLLPGGVLIAGLGTALAGVVHPYWLTFATIALAGWASRLPPEAARYANYVSGSRRASGMSLFSVGGNVGFAAPVPTSGCRRSCPCTSSPTSPPPRARATPP